jgi:uncharacterized protein YjbJ (UPF0337 family)
MNNEAAARRFATGICVWRNSISRLSVVSIEGSDVPAAKTMEIQMGQVTDKVKGAANEAAGKAKQAWGDATDNAATKAEGMGQELKGKAQKLKGDVKGAIDKL